ncbi:carbamoyl phosphate synthase large subunit [Desulfosarcina widdelii]|uniref:Carbamoyl phosphate synthase large subunit n=1 Tax=Desulfosarcina widdelii TaxID=947919 RepID=A0A5K7Z2U2_9BACT|nr:carbamoyl-phosphate synthase large subunit [Desulfosarcina widdelii]BBO72784.1 carbamoyl phosphate synthase large subunit [Desulfosarcina widdelii]
MPTPPLQKVLIIGCGPVKIGQTGAFDDAACRACRILRDAGVETVMVHCDPSALATDMETADRTYMVPLTVQSLKEVLLRERPDGLLPTVGGPTAMGLAKALVDSGLLEKKSIRLLGTTPETLAMMGDPSALFDCAGQLGLPTPDGRCVTRMAAAAAAAEAIGYPVFVRAAPLADRQRQGIVYNVEELRQLVSAGRLPSEEIEPLRIEEVLSDHREVEVELLRDADNRMQPVAIAENMEPVGIHSGDSMAAIPPLTLDTATCRQIFDTACKVAERMGAAGILHVKFAVAPGGRPVRVLSVNPWFSRMSAFCARSFGVDLAAVHARLCMGAGLDDILGDDAPEKEPAGIASIMNGKIVAVRLPRWEFERFGGEIEALNARMKSTGEVMGIGSSLLEALLKAERCRMPYHHLLGMRPEWTSIPLDDLMQRLVPPSPDCLAILHEALKKGARPGDLSTSTGIDIKWFRELAVLASLEIQLANPETQPPSPKLIGKAVEAGLNEAGLARLLNISGEAAAGLIEAAEIQVLPRAADANGQSRIWFTTLADKKAPHSPMGKSILIAGPGAGRIGHGIELDHCCAHAARRLQKAGRRSILVNSNPAVAGGLDDADRTYVAPLTAPDLKAVCGHEKPDGIILQFGGYAAMDQAENLESAGFTVLGTAREQVALSQDRLRFSGLLTEMGIPHPSIGKAASPEAAMDLAESIGFPLVVSVPADRHRNRYAVIMDADMLEQDLLGTNLSEDAPMLIEQFLEYAIELEADALCDGKSVYVPAVMEHIELAGVHSGDSSLVTPPYSTPPRHIETINAYIRKIALKLDVKGLLNARFAVYNDTVYLLAARPWACRTLPMVSKICDIPMARRAVDIMLGRSLDEMDLPRRLLPYCAIRSSVFPYDVFPQADPLLGPQMRSTGQVMTLAEVFGMAYFSSQQAAGPCLPGRGNLLVTVTDEDKPSILEPTRLFNEMGFGILATRGTHAFLRKNGIPSQLVKKIGFGRPDLVDAIKSGEVALVVNTPSGHRSQLDDALIRKTAIRYNIPNITTPAGAMAAAKGIAASKQGLEMLCTLQSYARTLR